MFGWNINDASTDNLRDIIELNWPQKDETTILGPMFHGTDASLINISESDLEAIRKSCDCVIRTLYELYKNKNVSLFDPRLSYVKDSYGSALNAFNFSRSYVCGSKLYCYGALYVSNAPRRACAYSREAWICGEQGWIAKLMIDGAKAIGIDLPLNDPIFYEAYKMIEDRRARKKQPIVLMLVGACIDELYYENGNNVRKGWPSTTPLSVSVDSVASYRLGEKTLKDDVSVYKINEDMFQELMSIWMKMN